LVRIGTASAIYSELAGLEDGVAKCMKNGNPVIGGEVSKYSEAYPVFLATK